MSGRKEILELALRRMSGFSLEKSNDNTNRSIFGLIKALIDSANGDTLDDCRKPLAAALAERGVDGRFHGCKVALLRQTIEGLFLSGKKILPDNEFAAIKTGALTERAVLLDYLEICRRIFVSKYAAAANTAVKNRNAAPEPEPETAMGKAMRLAMGKMGGIKK